MQLKKYAVLIASKLANEGTKYRHVLWNQRATKIIMITYKTVSKSNQLIIKMCGNDVSRC